MLRSLRRQVNVGTVVIDRRQVLATMRSVRKARSKGAHAVRRRQIGRASLALGLANLGLGLGFERPAAAYSVDVDATVIGQGYSFETADPGGATRVDRRRLTTYLGLYLGDLGRKDRDGLPAYRDQFSVTLNLRIDSDFGDYLCNLSRSSTGLPLTCAAAGQGVRTDPELSNYRPELLLAYAEGRSLGGFVDVRLGRQVLWDLFDMRGLDGGWLAVRTPLYLALEAWGGLSQNGALPIDPPLYVLDGTSRNVRFFPDDPRQQWLALQPTVGTSVRTHGLRDVQGRISYRRTFSNTADLLPPGCVYAEGRPCAAQTGTIEERLSATLYGRLFDGRLYGWSGLRYDILTGRFDAGEVELRGSLRRGHSLGAAYRYSAPTWDGDSIFNVFASEPYHHMQASYDGKSGIGRRAANGELSWHTRGFARLYRASHVGASASGQPGDALRAAMGGDAELRYRRPSGFVRLDTYCDGGYGGMRAGVDLSGRLFLLRDRIGLEGRVMYLYWEDDLRETSRSHGVSLQAGVRWALMRGALLHILIEDNVDRFYASQLRVLGQLDLSFLLGPHGGGRAPAGLLSAGFGEFPPPGLQPGIL